MLYVYNRNLELQGIIELFISYQLTEKFNKVGNFELHCPFSTNALEHLKIGNIIAYKNNPTKCVHIESRNLLVTQEGQELIVVKGKTLSNYLNYRILWNNANITDTPENIIKTLLYDNAINPNDKDRIIPFLDIENKILSDKTLSYSNNKHQNLLDAINDISNSNNLGFNIKADFRNKKLIFYMWKGVDRSYNNGSIAPILFSRDFENILEQNYLESTNNYKNSCLIAGAGEGYKRKKTSISKNNGLDRIEFYVDARDITDKKEIKIMVQNVDEKGNPTIGQHEETKEIEISWSEYEPKLITRGQEKLSYFSKTKAFVSKINNNSNNIYETDYFLGDTVTIKDGKWKITLNTVVTEVTTILNEQGLNIIPTFGYDIPNIFQKLKNERACL